MTTVQRNSITGATSAQTVLVGTERKAAARDSSSNSGRKEEFSASDNGHLNPTGPLNTSSELHATDILLNAQNVKSNGEDPLQADKIAYLNHLERACFDLQDREVIGTLDDLYWMLSAMEALADYAADKYSSCEETFLQLSCLIRLASSSVTTLLCKLDK